MGTHQDYAIELPHASMWWAPDGQIRFLPYADGGYPVIYGVHGTDGRRTHEAYVCAACAAQIVDYDPEEAHPTDLWWAEDANRITVNVHYEGAPHGCDGCGAMIDSAYGDPEEAEAV